MAKFRVKMNSAGAQALLKSGPIAADMLRRAEAIAARANSQMKPETRAQSVGFVADVIEGRTRARAAVKPGDIVARRENAKNNSILKAVDAGR